MTTEHRKKESGLRDLLLQLYLQKRRKVRRRLQQEAQAAEEESTDE